ncbi:hypothetical protein [Kocuria rosea]|uniref:hypothetical protein n=1 Tax=Kocuria rosea TaxID=1275 RepID=UPI00254164BB|nr:hypothetical protein [Kocuria rosea]WIG19332.1 hypothetical protein QOY29_18335 [Kocuria rosea]
MLDAHVAQQSRLLHQSLTQAHLTAEQLWWHYFSIGGDVGPLETDAYLHQALDLPRLQRTLLDHAAHELITS